MKAAEFTKSVKAMRDFYENNGGWAEHLASDIEESIYEGFIEGAKLLESNNRNEVRVKCEDGTVTITKKNGKLAFSTETDRYYEILERMWKGTNKNDLNAIRRYNEFRRQLRNDMLGE